MSSVVAILVPALATLLIADLARRSRISARSERELHPYQYTSFSLALLDIEQLPPRLQQLRRYC